MRICIVSMYLSFVTIPLSVLLFYGIEDRTAGYFDTPGNDKDNDFIGDYAYQTNRFSDNQVTYKHGLMVSHYSAIFVISAIGVTISLIVHEGFMAIKKVG